VHAEQHWQRRSPNSASCRGATTAEKLRGPRLGPNTGALARRCWVREGVAPSRCEGPGVSPPENFMKTQMLNPAFWWLLAVKFLAFFENYGQELEVGGPIHCCDMRLQESKKLMQWISACRAVVGHVVHESMQYVPHTVLLTQLSLPPTRDDTRSIV